MADNTQEDSKDWVSGDDPMTDAQESYLKTLAGQAQKPLHLRNPHPSRSDARPIGQGSAARALKRRLRRAAQHLRVQRRVKVPALLPGIVRVYRP